MLPKKEEKYLDSGFYNIQIFSHILRSGPINYVHKMNRIILRVFNFVFGEGKCVIDAQKNTVSIWCKVYFIFVMVSICKAEKPIHQNDITKQILIFFSLSYTN